MHANSVLCSRELGSRAGKFNKWMPEMATAFKPNANILACERHSDFMADHVGSTQAVIVVREKARVVR